MDQHELTLDVLKDILRAAAGEGDPGALDGDIADQPFLELGYDSLALLETGARIARGFGITLPDEIFTEAETPRELIEAVNAIVAVRTPA